MCFNWMFGNCKPQKIPKPSQPHQKKPSKVTISDLDLGPPAVKTIQVKPKPINTTKIASPTVISPMTSGRNTPYYNEKMSVCLSPENPLNKLEFRNETILIVDPKYKDSLKLKYLLTDLGFKNESIIMTETPEHANKLAFEREFQLIFIESDQLQAKTLSEDLRKEGKCRHSIQICLSIQSESKMIDFVKTHSKMNTYLSKHLNKNDLINTLEQLGIKDLPTPKYLLNLNPMPWLG